MSSSALACVTALAGLRACLLHGGGEAGTAGDVDLVIAPADLAAAERRLLRLSPRRIVQLIEHESSARYFVLASPRPDGTIELAALDICTDYRRDGRIFFTAEHLLADRVRAGGLWAAAPRTELEYLLVKKLSKGAVPLFQQERLAALCAALGDEARAAAIELLGPRWGALVHGWMARRDWAALEENSLRAARAARRRLALRDPFNPLRYRLSEVRRLARRLRLPTGLLVAVVGPDGAGKTTLALNLQTMLTPAFRRVDRFHLLPRVLLRRREALAPVTDPHGRRARGRTLSLLKAIYYLLEYRAGYLLAVRPLLVRSSLVIFDRYYHDLVVDPLRHRYGGSTALLKLVGRLIPQPDMLLVVDAPESDLQARKAEVSREEASRQRAAYRLLAREATAVLLDGAAAPEVVAREAAEAVLARLAERYQERRRLPRGPRDTPDWLLSILRLRRDGGNAVLRFRRLALRDGREYLLPVAGRQAAASLRSLYHPQGPRARAAAGLAMLGTRCGLAGALAPTVRAAPAAGPSLPDFLRTLFDTRDVSFAVAAGTPGDHRKPVVQVLDGQAKILAYCKVGWNAATIPLVRNEARVLKWLAATGDRGFLAPQLLHAGEWNGMFLCVQSAPCSPAAAPRALAPVYLEAERGLARLRSERKPLEESAAWKRLCGRALSAGGVPARLAQKALAAARELGAAEPMLFHASHGDFCPWNAALTGDELYVFDWEYARCLRPAGWDLFHLAFQTTWLVEGLRAERALLRLLPDGVDGALIARHLGEQGLQSRSAECALLLYLADRLTWWAGQPEDPRAALPRLSRMIRLMLERRGGSR